MLADVFPSVRVTAKAANRLRAGYPWVYAQDLEKNGAAGVGAGEDVVTVVDPRGQTLGAALYSAKSPLPLRLYSRQVIPFDDALITERLSRAWTYRKQLMPAADGFRWIHSEADLLPGLFIDVYGDVIVLQVASQPIESRLQQIAALAQRVSGARLVVARNDSSMRDFEALPRQSHILLGDGPTLARYHDSDNMFEVDVLVDGKTGGFLDQVENHARVKEIAFGDALDTFSYHGGFALALARGGCKSVLAIDESQPAVERARHNAEQNGLNQVTIEKGNAFDRLRELESQGRTFDVVVLDPPALAKRQSALGSAERAYKELNLRGLRLCRPGGLLITCSCSGKLRPGSFRQNRGRSRGRCGPPRATARTPRRGPRPPTAHQRARNRISEMLDSCACSRDRSRPHR